MLLTVFDDGKSEGEVVRIRAERFVIGRSEGDLRIAHDELISARHVEITRLRVGEAYRWVITDLQTTNGLFVRVSRTVLADKAEFLVGRGRYRLEAPTEVLPNTVDCCRRYPAGFDSSLRSALPDIGSAGLGGAADRGKRGTHPAHEERILDRHHPGVPRSAGLGIHSSSRGTCASTARQAARGTLKTTSRRTASGTECRKSR